MEISATWECFEIFGEVNGREPDVGIMEPYIDDIRIMLGGEEISDYLIDYVFDKCESELYLALIDSGKRSY